MVAIARRMKGSISKLYFGKPTDSRVRSATHIRYNLYGDRLIYCRIGVKDAKNKGRRMWESRLEYP